MVVDCFVLCVVLCFLVLCNVSVDVDCLLCCIFLAIDCCLLKFGLCVLLVVGCYFYCLSFVCFVVRCLLCVA